MAYPRGFIIGPEKALRNKLWLCRSKYALHLLSFIGFKTPLSIEFISMQARGRLISGGGGGRGNYNRMYCEQELHERYHRKAKCSEDSWL